MKETPLSNVERAFLIAAVKSGKRIDGRDTYDYRNIKITFGCEKGCCEVQLGQTRVLACVTCDVIQPKNARPTDGQLYLNLELSPMASSGFEAGRLSEYGVELNRLLERCIKDSRAVDMESLCIVAGEKVWQIRVDVHVLNHDGSILDCASVAAITALSHFRRPDVTIIGEAVTIHTAKDRDPVPLNVHHLPVCITFAFIEQGKYLLVDPSLKEESVMEGNMVMAMNAHRELCTVQMTGGMLLLKDQILRCSQIAVVKVTELTELIKRSLSNDEKARSERKNCSYAESLPRGRLTTTTSRLEAVSPADVVETSQRFRNQTEPVEDCQVKADILEAGFGEIGEGAANTWLIPGKEVVQEEMEVDTEPREQLSMGKEPSPSDDSEEEDTVMLNPVDSSHIAKHVPSDPSIDLDLSVALNVPHTVTSSSSGSTKRKTRRKVKKRPDDE